VIRLLAALALVSCTAPIGAAFTVSALETGWPRHVITVLTDTNGGPGGADGVFLYDDFVLAAHEQARRTTRSQRPADPAQPWPTLVLSGVGLAEHAIAVDLNGDGVRDILTASEDNRIVVHCSPAFAPATITASQTTPATRWMQLAWTSWGLVGGSRTGPGQIALFVSATPCDGASWSRQKLDDAGWPMSIAEHDGRIVISDKGQIQICNPTCVNSSAKRGFRYLEQDATGAWSNTMIRQVLTTEGDPRFLHVGEWRVDGLDFIGLVSAVGKPNASTLYTARGIVPGWFDLPIAPPASMGELQDVEPCDLTGDGIPDLVYTATGIGEGESGVAALVGPDFTERVEISGPGLVKVDTLACSDVDGNGRNDVVTTDETLGVLWFANEATP
jgi:hypothetical protein